MFKVQKQMVWLLLIITVMLISTLGCSNKQPGESTWQQNEPAKGVTEEANQPTKEQVAPKELKKIVIALPSKNFTMLPFQMANERGYFKEEGLEVELMQMKSGTAVPAVTSREVDYIAHFGSSIRGAIAGLPVRVIFSSADRQLYSVVTKPEIKRPEELKGKIIGVQDYGGSQHLVTLATLRKLGFDPDKDMKVISVGDELVRLEQMKMGKIDAALIQPPISIQAKREGFNLIVNVADLLELPITGLSSSLDNIAQNKDEVKRTLRAVVRGLQEVHSNKQATTQLIVNWVGINQEVAGDTYDVAIKSLSKTGLVSDAGMLAAIEEAKSASPETINKEVKIDDVANFALLKEVLDELKIKY